MDPRALTLTYEFVARSLMCEDRDATRSSAKSSEAETFHFRLFTLISSGNRPAGIVLPYNRSASAREHSPRRNGQKVASPTKGKLARPAPVRSDWFVVLFTRTTMRGPCSDASLKTWRRAAAWWISFRRAIGSNSQRRSAAGTQVSVPNDPETL